MEKYKESIIRINEALNQFKDYFNPEKKIDFKKLGGDIKPESYTLIEGNLQNQWIESDQPGVYFIFAASKDGKPTVYIGKASMNSTVGQRLYKHYKDFYPPDGDNKILWGDGYIVEAIAIIPLYENGFIAPSLEEFLISTLKSQITLSNSMGNI
jgi:hypothetical protein